MHKQTRGARLVPMLGENETKVTVLMINNRRQHKLQVKRFGNGADSKIGS